MRIKYHSFITLIILVKCMHEKLSIFQKREPWRSLTKIIRWKSPLPLILPIIYPIPAMKHFEYPVIKFVKFSSLKKLLKIYSTNFVENHPKNLQISLQRSENSNLYELNNKCRYKFLRALSSLSKTASNFVCDNRSVIKLVWFYYNISLNVRS